jgi:molybdate transport system substrate-binding protein
MLRRQPISILCNEAQFRVIDRMKRRDWCKPHALILLAISLCLAGCHGARDEQAQVPLRIAAASDLQIALPVLLDRFRSRTGVATTPVFDASGRLAEQIKNGAPYDIFMAANITFVDDLAKAGLIGPESVHPYAQGSLVVAVYRELGDRIRDLSDLKKPEVRKIALANPGFAPYGKAGRQALERAGLWKELEPKIVQAESVKQALVYAQRGDAEAAFVGRALVANAPEVHTFAVDQRLYDPIVQAMGILTSSTHGADAEKFIQFVLSDEGQEILKGFGFTVAEATRVGQ